MLIEESVVPIPESDDYKWLLLIFWPFWPLRGKYHLGPATRGFLIVMRCLIGFAIGLALAMTAQLLVLYGVIQ